MLLDINQPINTPIMPTCADSGIHDTQNKYKFKNVSYGNAEIAKLPHSENI